MIIHLTLRDGNLVLPKKEFDTVFDFDWFLNLLVKFPNHSDKPEDSVVEYTLWEEKNAVLSILDSLRYNKLILYETNLGYLAALADKWCVPQWLINEINDRNKSIVSKSLNSKSSLEEVNQEINKLSCLIKRCQLCNIGFNLFDNTSTSCKRHIGYLAQISNEYKYTCCGFAPNNFSEDDPRKNGCKIGYHVSIN